MKIYPLSQFLCVNIVPITVHSVLHGISWIYSYCTMKRCALDFVSLFPSPLATMSTLWQLFLTAGSVANSDPRPTTRCKGNRSTHEPLYQLCFHSPTPATACAWPPLFLGELDWSIHIGVPVGWLVTESPAPRPAPPVPELLPQLPSMSCNTYSGSAPLIEP